MKDNTLMDDTDETTVDLDRRRALARLGLGLSAAYVVPALVTLSRGAHASGGDGSGGDGSGGSASGGSASGGSASGGSASGGSASGGSDGSEDLVLDGSGPSD